MIPKGARFRILPTELVVLKPDNSVMKQDVAIIYEPLANRYLVHIKSGFLKGWIITLESEKLDAAMESQRTSERLVRE